MRLEHPQAQKLGLAETVLEQLRHLSAIAAQPQLPPSTGSVLGQSGEVW